MDNLKLLQFKSLFVILHLILSSIEVNAQVNISTLSYEQFDSLAIYSKDRRDFESMKLYVDQLLRIAKASNDTLRIANAYVHFLSSENSNEVLKYCDSLINLTSSLNNNFNYPAYGLIYKGDILFQKGKIHEALKQYISAKEYSTRRKNIDQTTFIIQRIAKIKTMLDNHQDALDLHKEFLDITNRHLNSNDLTRRSILDAYYNLTYSYLKLNHIDSAQISLNLAKIKALEYNISDGIVNHLPDLNAEIDYYSGNYEKAIEFFNSERDSAEGLHLIANLYYSGKISIIQNEDNLAITYFEAMDSVLLERDFPFQNAKDGLAELSLLYKKKNMPVKELRAINRYLQLDSTQISFANKSRTLVKNKFDKPYIIQQRQYLVQKLKTSTSYIYLQGALIVISLLLIAYLIRSRILLKKRIQQLILEGYDVRESYNSKPNDASLKDNSEQSNRIRIGLKYFEENKGFLDKDLSLLSLAQQLESNSSYLSRFVNNEMGINFSTYLNGLRIQYAIQQINSNNDLKKYNLNGLAQQFGYHNSNTFSRAFIKTIGVKPSTYISSLNKNK